MHLRQQLIKLRPDSLKYENLNLVFSSIPVHSTYDVWDFVGAQHGCLQLVLGASPVFKSNIIVT